MLFCFSFGLTELVVMVVVRGFGDVRVMEKGRSSDGGWGLRVSLIVVVSGLGLLWGWRGVVCVPE